jgi:hypothetical protein
MNATARTAPADKASPAKRTRRTTRRRAGALWGNFPQPCSMAGIIDVATRLPEKWEGVWCRV